MRTAGASACRVGLGVLPLGAAIATVLLASWAGAPWGLTGTGAAVVLGVIASCFVWVCVGSKVAAELERRNAEDTLLADAALQTVLAIQCGADRRIALERLGRLLPEGMGGAEDAGSVREAA
jgi:flagellar motor component MotA